MKLKVGDSVELNGNKYTVTHSWREHQRHDIPRQCVRMKTERGATWAGYESDLHKLLTCPGCQDERRA